MSKAHKFQYDPQAWVVSPPDELHLTMGGDMLGKLAGQFAPSTDQIREMLIAVRHHGRWSKAFAACVLGVPKTTYEKWEAGKRNPSGAAAKLIFFLHSQVVEDGQKIKNCWDLALWGTIPCRNSLPMVKLGGTYWIPPEVMEDLARHHSTTSLDRGSSSDQEALDDHELKRNTP